jgi:ribosomal protein L16 Arg81 hydroxylase
MERVMTTQALGQAQTQARAFDLTALLAPISPEDFFCEFWERKPLHLSRGSAQFYDSLLTNGDLETIISSSDLRYPAIQLAKNGSYLAPEAYTRNIKHGSEFFNGVPDLGQIQSEYRSGATVVLPALQRTWPPLRQLCEALEDELSHPVHANAYLTPGASPGFTPHYDTHEVLVLQIAGIKHWRVFQPAQPLPHRSQPFAPIGYVLPSPLLELELKPGDLLYLPRGYVHAAHTSGGHSAHVTLVSFYCTPGLMPIPRSMRIKDALASGDEAVGPRMINSISSARFPTTNSSPGSPFVVLTVVPNLYLSLGSIPRGPT